MRNIIISTLVSLSIVACVPATAPSHLSPVTAEWKRSGDNVLTRADFDSLPERTLDRALNRLRPEFLTTGRRGLASLVIVDGAEYNAEFLRQIHTNEVERVEWLSVSDVAARYGNRFVGAGVIITTRAR